jgi:ATP-binding cassette subfamily F protein 3
VFEEILAAARVGATLTELRDLLGQFLFRQDEVHKKIAVLSGGERARLALARLLLRPANLLLLDEPTNHLDIASREVLEAALRAFVGTVLIASHDRYLLDRVVTRIVEVRDGQLASYPGNYTRYRERRGAIATVARSGASRGIAVSSTSAAAARSDQSGGSARRALMASAGSGPSADRPHRPERVAPNGGMRAEHRVARVEDLIDRRAALEARLADPALWTDARGASQVVDELTRVQSEIDAASSSEESIVGLGR